MSEVRLRPANDCPIREHGEYVLYWCQMFRRLSHNHALDAAIQLAETLNKPLVIYEGLKLNYPWANSRIHTFMLEGMRDNAATAARLGANYWPFVETPRTPGRGLVRTLAAKACAVVTDDYPAFIIPAQIRALASKVDVAVIAVDSNGVVPLSRLGARTSAAVHLRSRIQKLFPEEWPRRANRSPKLSKTLQVKVEPPFAVWQPPQDIGKYVATLPVDASVPPLPGVEGGSTAGRRQLKKFLDLKLHRYAEGRSGPDHPDVNAASGISPWLHYGHISIEEVVAETLKSVDGWSLDDINRNTRNSKNDYYCRDANINGFLDEAVTWRDLGTHWHYTRSGSGTVSWQTALAPSFNFETMDFSPLTRGTLETVLPEWAKTTLTEHAGDRREHIYTLEEFERGHTHDVLWNATQTELVLTGRIHNYLRMLWAKKVLEWSSSPEAAYRVLEHLNNKYAIDGRDPNSYSGILWCFGLFDRPWPPEREVFGRIRYMSSPNTARKFNLQAYYDYIATLRR